MSSGTVTIDKSAIYGNTVSGTGADGGGIHINDGGATFDIKNTSIFGNTAADKGGGVHVSNASTANFTHVTIHKNRAVGAGGINRAGGTVNLRNSIVSGSTSDGTTVIADCAGTVSLINTHIQSNDCSASYSGDPGLTSSVFIETGKLPHYALLSTSSARGRGANAQCAAGGGTDQVGTTRPATDCDIGAVQYRVLPTATPTATNTPTATATATASPTRHPTDVTLNGTTCNIYDAITAANTNTATGSCPAGRDGNVGTNEPDLIVLQRDITMTGNFPKIVDHLEIESSTMAIQYTIDGR